MNLKLGKWDKVMADGALCMPVKGSRKKIFNLPNI